MIFKCNRYLKTFTQLENYSENNHSVYRNPSRLMNILFVGEVKFWVLFKLVSTLRSSPDEQYFSSCHQGSRMLEYIYLWKFCETP